MIVFDVLYDLIQGALILGIGLVFVMALLGVATLGMGALLAVAVFIIVALVLGKVAR